jgi:MarR family transcriptional regulator, organic hydroperoxide resistance regulator
MKVDNAFFLIGRIKEHYTAFLEDELGKRGMKQFVTSHADIIAVLGIFGELTMSEVAQKINRDRSTVTALVSKLEKFKYVRQRKNEADLRSSYLSLTEKGKDLIPEFMSITNALFKKATKGISEEEWSSFREVLKKLYENFS